MAKDGTARIMNMKAGLISLVFLIIGSLLIAIPHVLPNPSESHLWWHALLHETGALIVATGLLGFFWDIFIRREFRDEILEKLKISSAIDKSGLEEVTESFYDLEWERLFKDSKELDIVLSYGGTWRNLNKDRIKQMLNQKGAHIRIFLPDPSNDFLMLALAQRYHKTQLEIKNKVIDAIRDFQSIKINKNCGKCEIYLCSTSCTWSAYKFQQKLILSLYTHGEEKSSPPSFVFKKGAIGWKYASNEIAILCKSSHKAENPYVPPKLTFVENEP